MPSTTLDVIHRQIDDAQADLQQYRPQEMKWADRAKASAGILVPWLDANAAGMKQYVEGVLNAPMQLRRMWTHIRAHVNLPKEQIESFDRQLTLDDVLRESVTGELISKVVTKFLLDHNAALQTNGRSDYPDIFLQTLDYSGLQAFRRAKAGDVAEYGAALKKGRPVRVPDGLEIKTCRDSIRVDCHYAHAGMHLCLIFGNIDRVFTMTDLRIAFLRTSDYRIAVRNTETTTVKASFNGDRFVSLFPGS
jgi:hypothetical protein